MLRCYKKTTQYAYDIIIQVEIKTQDGDPTVGVKLNVTSRVQQCGTQEWTQDGSKTPKSTAYNSLKCNSEINIQCK